MTLAYVCPKCLDRVRAATRWEETCLGATGIARTCDGCRFVVTPAHLGTTIKASSLGDLHALIAAPDLRQR